MFRAVAFLLPLLLLHPTLARADTGAATEPTTSQFVWHWDALVLFNLALLGSLYYRGLARLRRRSGRGRGVSRGRAVAFFGALAVVFIALISPLDALSDAAASAHMVQHMLLMVVAAPLFVFAMPRLVLTWGIAKPWRAPTGRLRAWFDFPVLRRPLVPWLLYAAVLWVWHLPAAYEAALVDPLVHDAQHLSFFGVACLYWQGILTASPRRRLSPLAAVLVLFTTSLHASLLGVFMATSRVAWYGVYSQPTPWGLTPLEDQHLAGFIMWMPACLIYPAVAAATFGIWLSKLSRGAETPAGTQATGATPSDRRPERRALRGVR